MTLAKVLVTGAGGFIGKHLVPALAASGYHVIAATNSTTFPQAGVTCIKMPDLAKTVDWPTLIGDADRVIHLAAIAHRPTDDFSFCRVNGRAVAELASVAKSIGVKQLVFVSSIAAQVGSAADRLVTEEDFPRPVNAYGRAKLAAEQAVKASGIPFTVLRPAVTMGPDAKGNFGTLARLIKAGIPLPFGMLKSQRSVLSIQNFVSAVLIALKSSAAIDQTYIVADPNPETISAITRKFAAMIGMRPIIVPIPAIMLKAGFQVTGRSELWDRLGRPLIVSSARLQAIGWTPS
ncbi:MAG: NAD-dependent epimerase/dehydratase family protein [Rhizobiales bacterium]|nr:NAD-dependent epimerase/dehydratase family protein [Hyphomicrobiales bacterium]